jgi:hypothetical protein
VVEQVVATVVVTATPADTEPPTDTPEPTHTPTAAPSPTSTATPTRTSTPTATTTWTPWPTWSLLPTWTPYAVANATPTVAPVAAAASDDQPAAPASHGGPSLRDPIVFSVIVGLVVLGAVFGPRMWLWAQRMSSLGRGAHGGQ